MVRTLSQVVTAEIRAEMGRRQLSQQELARRLGCSENAVSLWLRGRRSLSLDRLEAIANALDVPVQRLVRPELLPL